MVSITGEPTSQRRRSPFSATLGGAHRPTTGPAPAAADEIPGPGDRFRPLPRTQRAQYP